MKLQTFEGTLAKETTFTDIAMGVYWQGERLWDEEYSVGRVMPILSTEKDSRWMAEPHWNEPMGFFDTEEEAKAWLVAVYKMGGQSEPKKHRVKATKR
jgi:hypothetical protein